MSSLRLLCNYSVHIIRTPVDSGVELLTNSLQKGLRKLDLNIRRVELGLGMDVHTCNNPTLKR